MDIQTTDQAHENYEYICKLRHSINNGFWILVEQLKKCREEKYWQTLGYETFASYLAQPEIDFNLRTVDNWITTYNHIKTYNLLTQYGSIDMAVSRLAIVAPHLTKENAAELLYKAKTLSRKDLIAEVTGKEPIIKEKCTCLTCGNIHYANQDNR
jgi:hypothetical protein